MAKKSKCPVKSRHISIGVFLENLDSQEKFDVAADALIAFLHDMFAFPKPIGIEGVTMTENELRRYHDGWNAAMESSAFMVALVTGNLKSFIQSRSGKTTKSRDNL